MFALEPRRFWRVQPSMGRQPAIRAIGGQAARSWPRPAGPEGGRFAVTVHASIAEIRRDAWSEVFPRSRQSWDYYAAGERMSAPGFSFGAIGAYYGETLVGAAPMFRVDYRLDEPLGRSFQTIGNWLHRVAPSSITMPVLALGSPIADECQIGMLPGLD